MKRSSILVSSALLAVILAACSQPAAVTPSQSVTSTGISLSFAAPILEVDSYTLVSITVTASLNSSSSSVSAASRAASASTSSSSTPVYSATFTSPNFPNQSISLSPGTYSISVSTLSKDSSGNVVSVIPTTTSTVVVPSTGYAPLSVTPGSGTPVITPDPSVVGGNYSFSTVGQTVPPELINEYGPQLQVGTSTTMFGQPVIGIPIVNNSSVSLVIQKGSPSEVKATVTGYFISNGSSFFEYDIELVGKDASNKDIAVFMLMHADSPIPNAPEGTGFDDSFDRATRSPTLPPQDPTNTGYVINPTNIALEGLEDDTSINAMYDAFPVSGVAQGSMTTGLGFKGAFTLGFNVDCAAIDLLNHGYPVDHYVVRIIANGRDRSVTFVLQSLNVYVSWTD